MLKVQANPDLPASISGPCHPRVCAVYVLQANVATLTRERDELAKNLFFAEFARDQTKAAQQLARNDMVKARCDGIGWWTCVCGDMLLSLCCLS